jgi:hypothetical protein
MEPAFTAAQRIKAISRQLPALEASGLLDRRYTDWLRAKLQVAAWADARGYSRVAAGELQGFARDSAWLAKRGALNANVATLLGAAVREAAECSAPPERDPHVPWHQVAGRYDWKN